MIINWCGRCGVELKTNAGYCPDCERERRKLSKEVKEENLKKPFSKPESNARDNSRINLRKFSGRKS